MAIKLKLENGDSILIDDSDTEMDAQGAVELVFAGTSLVKYDPTSIDDYDLDNMLFGIDKDIDIALTYGDGKGYYVRIVSAEWVDPSLFNDEYNDFKFYVLNYLNQQGVAVAFDIAAGNDQCWKMWEAIENKFVNSVILRSLLTIS